MDRNYVVITFNLKYRHFERARVANFAEIIETAATLIKKTFENSKLKELEWMN